VDTTLQALQTFDCTFQKLEYSCAHTIIPRNTSLVSTGRNSITYYRGGWVRGYNSPVLSNIRL
jgi:hypothetical protein